VARVMTVDRGAFVVRNERGETCAELAGKCRFSNCTHTQEPGCAVLAALAAGELSQTRYQSFLKLQRETEHHDLSYAQKRKKDRDFGRFIKSAQKRPKR
jgi:ribosome biogenesis GTPase